MASRVGDPLLWAIQQAHGPGFATITVPFRLGSPQESVSPPLTLDVVGDDWMASLIRALWKPREPWGWWTRTEIFKDTPYRCRSGPTEVDLAKLREPIFIKGRFLSGRGMVLAPAGIQVLDDQVAEWAGTDVEQFPEILFTLRDENVVSPSLLMDACAEATAANPLALLRATSNSYFIIDDSCMTLVTKAVDPGLVAALESLAAGWNLKSVFSVARTT